LADIVLVCFEGGSATSVAGPLEVFGRLAARPGRPGGTAAPALAVVTPRGAPVTCAGPGRLTVRPTAAVGAAGRPGLVFLAGAAPGVAEAPPDPALGGWLLALRAEGVAVAAACPSQALLAGLGLLDGRAAAVHWGLLEEFRARWPAVGWTAGRVVAEEDGLYTCCGASSALDLALYAVDRLFGAGAMADCARWLLADLPRVRQNLPPPLFAAASPPSDPAMARVEAWLRAHLGEPVRLEEVAGRFGMPWRTFHRHFRAAFGEAPKPYLQKLRLEAARRVLEDDGAASVEEVARRVGYEDPVFFRALFKRHAGVTPSAYREGFRFRSRPSRRGDVTTPDSGGATEPAAT
jgi:transcriptional regulator GlxA family with amidase domain